MLSFFRHTTDNKQSTRARLSGSPHCSSCIGGHQKPETQVSKEKIIKLQEDNVKEMKSDAKNPALMTRERERKK